MQHSEIISKYFPKLSDLQKDQFKELFALYEEWNAQINVVSRKEFENFYIHHVLHSLGIAKILFFADGMDILDVGTGGGFPGIPLAILFPKCNFTLVDSIGKKIKVVNEVANALGLTNVTAINDRAENLKQNFDFVVSRAVTRMDAFIPWVEKKINKKSKDLIPNGILYLKGGDLIEEMSPIKHYYKIHDLKNYFEEDFFETKKVVYVKMV